MTAANTSQRGLSGMRARWRQCFAKDPKRAERGTLRMARGFGWATFLFFIVALAPAVAHAKKAAAASGTVGGIDLVGDSSISNRPLILMVAMAGLALVPFVGMMVTSFVKIAVVLSITRQAIGTQQAPPTTVITGMAIILTVYKNRSTLEIDEVSSMKY